MKVTGINLKDVALFPELEIKPGKVTRISAKNRCGKSAVIDALCSVQRGGSLARLVRDGSEEAEVVIVTDAGYKARKRLAKNEVIVTDPNGIECKRPMQVVHELFGPAIGANPIEMLKAATPEDRKKKFAAAMPLSVTKERIEKATGYEYTGDTSGHALEILNKCRKFFYDQRRDVNRDIDLKKKAAQELAAAIGPEPAAEKVSLQQWRATQQSNIQRHQEAREAAIKSVSDKTDEHRKTFIAESAKKVKAHQDRIAELESEIKAERAAIAAEELALEQKTANLERQAAQVRQAKLEEVDAKYKPEADRITAAIATAEEREKGAAARKAQQAIIERTQREASELETQSADLTAAIEGLDNLRDELVKECPLSKEIEFREDDVYIREKETQQWRVWVGINEAERMKAAIKAAVFAVKDAKCPLILCDGLNEFDKDAIAAFEKVAAGFPKVQFIYTLIGDSDQVEVEVRA